MPTFPPPHATSNSFSAEYTTADVIPLVTTTILNAGISIPLGIFIGLLASFVQSLGLAIQRRSHVLNSQLPEPERKVEHRRPLWLLGFAIFLTSNIFGSFIQIASLPVVILAPLGAVSLLWNALFARLLLRPPLILGTALIAGGAALIAVYGIVPETPRSLDELMALFARPAFIAWFCVEGAVVLVCLIATHVAEYSFTRRLEAASYALLRANGDSIESSLCASPDSSPRLSPTSVPPASQYPSVLTTGLAEELATTTLAHERTPLLDPKTRATSPKSSLHKSRSSSPHSSASASTGKSTPPPPIPGRTPLLLALAYAAASGTLSGLCLIFAKSGVELLVLTLGGSNQFYRWEAWALVGGLVAFALGQLWYLNRGLRLADPAFVCPSAFCFYNFSSILNGLVYFNQLNQLPGLNIGLVVLGMLILLAGVWAVSAQAGVDPTYPDEQGHGSEENLLHEDISALPPAIEVDADLDDDGTDPSSQHPRTNATVPLSPSRSRPGKKAHSERGGGGYVVAPPMERQARSEGALGLEGSMSMHTLHPVSPSQGAQHSTFRPRLILPRSSSHRTPTHTNTELTSPSTTRSSRRRRATVLDPHHPHPRTGSIHTMSSSVSGSAGQGMSPAGLTIGLSPVSPGFGFGGGVGTGQQRRSRRVSGMSGLGLGISFADVVESVQAGGEGGGRSLLSVESEDRDGRRAVSEGDVRRRWDAEGGEHLESGAFEAAAATALGARPDSEGVTETGLGESTAHPAGLRWKWLRRVFTGHNERGR
ncbi:hypothetical protein HYDPIDRAFT_36916 [Hydnomerulius pinastri MD-312]|nr:hypothetical protein HYDPIDRAFT_36916 [Hydnomerulius pinastri MD-312]